MSTISARIAPAALGVETTWVMPAGPYSGLPAPKTLPRADVEIAHDVVRAVVARFGNTSEEFRAAYAAYRAALASGVVVGVDERGNMQVTP